MKYVVSFTTSPTRILKCIPMINSILSQTRKPDAFILNVPEVFQRTGEKYIIPKFISDKLIVNIVDKDYGPGTKLIPTIKYLKQHKYDPKNTRIIYLDDDISYMPRMIETVENTIFDDDDSTWTSTGFDFVNLELIGQRDHDKIATIAEGYGGVCVKLSIFKDDFFEYIEKYIQYEDCRLSDDMILSNYYHKVGVSIKIINIRDKYSIFDMWDNKCIMEYGKEDDALHNGACGTSVNNVKRYNKVIKQLNANKERYFKIYFLSSSANEETSALIVK